ncbi:HAD-IIIC family phosphatase [Marnyiella aurantia]|uniref:HAD-IIIC family phosphatase n=1 Tax=Marnyiella aurantia TaxID=2758037 RepID=A0A7D7QLK1_9FLAO|nr:HAD-IIIC family phosphatase [Marnyiella aurantia]MBA5247449.1 HAD-IIIC family phosphatase [Marnyiella aurantia]QMS99205.1 HAD-IIIC family phosphatase [Marnyiella aurantia]
MENLTYSEILQQNVALRKNLEANPGYKISVLSNIIVHQLKEIMEYDLRLEKINASLEFGDFDNIVQDSAKVEDSNAVVIFWELCNLVEGLYLKIEQLTEERLEELVQKTCLEIDLTFRNLKSSSLVIFHKFTPSVFSFQAVPNSNLEVLADRLNSFVVENKPDNVILVNIEKVFNKIGLNRSVNFRHFYSSQALYSIDFFKNYAQLVKPIFTAANGKTKKALIFDCDNTLWRGILGEDGFEKIQMSAHFSPGVIFHEIQSLAVALSRKGVLIGLCSKNNPGDVDQVVQEHPDMLIREEIITIKKVNWTDKAMNLRQIASDLNIGLDSIVFVDDSSFETNLIKEQIPEITVLQVPEKIYEYPDMLRSNLGLFFNNNVTQEDLLKAKIYKEQSEREDSKKSFSKIEDYLTSLDLSVKIFKDDRELIPRMSQLTQKTNQFNLTTKRYTDIDIQGFVASGDYAVYAWSVSDKFGDNGLTGLSIVDLTKELLHIDTFLMSCRIIGRNIEYKVMDYIIRDLRNTNYGSISAIYTATPKNMQVAEFYENCSFDKENGSDGAYKLNLDNYRESNINYIKIENGNKN